MKKLWLLILTSLFLSACGASGSVPSFSTAEVKPKVGETVAYVSSRQQLSEGVVESLEGARYKIKYGTATETKEESDVYALPKAGAKPTVKVGDMVAAKTESGANYWAGAEVLSINGDVVEVKELVYGKTMSLAPDKILVVRPAAAAEFQKVKAEKDFSAKAVQGKPRPSAGYKPKVGDRVVAEWMANSWYDGEITGVTGEKAKIKWSRSFNDSEVAFDKVIPYPKAESSTTLPVAGSYVLVKPEGGPGQWSYAQVTAVNGNSADVKFADGKTRAIKADDYIALS